jgi:hypothetical protein
MSKLKTAAILYGLVGIPTFGHEAHWRWTYNHDQTCLAGEKLETKVGCEGQLPPPLGGIVAAIYWPLYWSWVAQS